VAGLFVASLAGIAWYTGIGGETWGPTAVLAGLGVSAAVLTYVLSGPVANRIPWAVFAAIVGVIVGAQVVAAAPWSHERLLAILDDNRFPAAIATDRRGSSTCRPACPVVVRTYELRQNPSVAGLTVLTVLVNKGFQPAPRLEGGDTLVATNDKVEARITAERESPQDATVVRLELRAERG
jgi:hypothetical protein